MQVRRALLLFAIVLGLAAVVASVSNPRDDKDDSSQAEPPAVPGESAEARAANGEGDVEFSIARPRSRQVESGRAITVRVYVEDPGQVEIQGLGQSTPADDVTPARFELLPSRPGSYPVEFTSAAGDSTRSVGTLVVVSPEP